MMSGETGAQNAIAPLANAIHSIRQKIAAACERSGRDIAEITLVAVSKTVSAENVRAAIAAGVTVLGENRVQEAEAKMQALSDLRSQVAWHLIGHLQSNKARKAVALFDVVQSVDSEDLAIRLNNLAAEYDKKLPIFIEVNLGEEHSKAGITAASALPLIEKISQFSNLQVQGLMAVPPYLEDANAVRPYFRQLRNLRDEALRAGIAAPSFQHLSMGMSHDFEVAIEEGATFVRVGTALFGARNYSL